MCIRDSCPAAKCLAAIAIPCMGVLPRCVCFVAFLHLNFSSTCQPPIQSWTWLYHMKATPSQNSTYILRREILSTFHTRVDNRSIRHFCIVFTLKLPLPLRRLPPKSNTPLPSPTPLITPNGIRIHSPMSPLLTSVDRQISKRKFYHISASLYGATR